MQTPSRPDQGQSSKPRWPIILVASVVALFLIGALSDSADTGTTPGDREIGGDSSAQLACRDFYDVAAEVDLMNDAELRERIQGIWDYAEVSETPGISEAARDMLATVTAGDIDAFEVAVADMQTACEPVDPL